MLLPIIFFWLTTRQLRGPIFSCSPDTPLNNLIHHTSLPALTKKNATKVMSTASSLSNYIQSKNKQCVVITSIALTICSTHLYHLCALANTYWPLGIYASLCSMVLYSVLSFFFGYFLITHLYYPKFLATKKPNKIQTAIS